MQQMDPKYEALFTPWKIGNVEIKNRIVMCPMGGTSLFGWMEHTGNHFDKEAAKFFLDKAKNNVGLIIPGIAPIRSTYMGQWLYQNKKMFAELKEYMEEIHKTGAKLFVQITAGMGRSWAIPTALVPLHNTPVIRDVIKPIIDIPYQCASPSVLPSRWSDKVMCREITVKEIEEIVDAFAKTAELCKWAGVDGVEVHAVHEGYLIDQFTLKYTNKRTDKYGGSFENRYRFAVDIVKAIKEKCGEDYPVSLRYSVESKVKDFGVGAVPGEEYTEIGRDMEESEKAAKYLQDAGYDMLNADNGTYDSWYWSHPPMYMPLNCNLDDVAHIKKFVDIPVVCAGRMEPDVGAKAVEEGLIDGVGVARQFLADSEWITKLMENRMEDIKPCICCHNACFNMSHYKGVANAQSIYDASHIARCALNPPVMQSNKYEIKPAKKQKKIAIIGGGIGGMEAAIVCAKRGHKVVLLEKTERLGGVFHAAAAPSFKEKDKMLIAWYEREIKKYPNLKVRLNTEITNVKVLKADEVIIATGAKARTLPNKGDVLSWSESSAVVYANSVLGARCNRNSGIIDMMGSIVGYVPYFGLLTDEGRKADWIVEIKTTKKPEAQLLGSAIGMKVMEDVPYIVGLDQWIGTELDDKTCAYLKDFGAATASNGAVGLYHVENLTPEAKESGKNIVKENAKVYVVDDAELQRVYDSYPVIWKNPDASPKLCFMGCPHMSLEQLTSWTIKIGKALKAEGKKKVVIPTVFTAAPAVVKEFEKTKYARPLKAMGVVVSSICPLMYMNNPLCGKMPVITSSNKLRTYTTARYYTDDEILEQITKGGK